MRDFWWIMAVCLFAGQPVSGQSDTLHTATDTTFVDNIAATELMQQAQSENRTSTVKEAVLTEQLRSTGDALRRRELERQLRLFREADSVRQAGMRRQIDSLRQTSIGAPVILRQDTVLTIYTKFGAFTPAERAERNSEKLLLAARLFLPGTDSLQIADSGSTIDIIYRGTTLLSVSELDALWMNRSKDSLAFEYERLIIKAIEKYKKDTGIITVSKQVGLSVLVIFCVIGIIFGINYLFFRILNKKIKEQRGRLFKGFKIRNLEIVDAGRQIQTALFLLKVFRYLAYLLLFYIALPVLFSIFPLTERWADILFGWILSPLEGMWIAFWKYLPDLLQIVVIIVVMRYVARFIKYIMKEIETGRMTIPGFYPEWAKATYNMIRLFLIAFTLVLVFPLLPRANSDIFKGVSVFIGVLFSLGSTSIIGNIVAGLVITYMRSFKIGDRIKVGDVFGDVIEKTPFVIRVKTVKMEVVTVPNMTILSSNVVNYSTSAVGEGSGVILYTTITMGYEVPRETVVSLLIRAALQTEDILPEPTPFVLQTGLGDFCASYQINAYTKNPEKQALIYSELNRNIQELFLAAGIEMIVPHYRAVRDGNPSTLPKDPEQPAAQK